MRNAGDRPPGGSSSRRQRAADTEPPPPGGGASLFTPAYRVSQPATGSNTGGGHPSGSSTRGARGIGYHHAAYAAAPGAPPGLGAPGSPPGAGAPRGPRRPR